MTVAVIEDLAPQPITFAEREERWGSVVGDRLGPMAVRLDPAVHTPGGEAVASRCLGGLTLTRWDCPAMVGRSHRKVEESAERGVAIFVGHAGHERLRVADDELALTPGALLVVGSDSRARFRVPRWVRKQTLVLSESVLVAAGYGRDLPAARVLEPDRPLAGLFRSYMSQLWDQVAVMNAREAEAARTALVTLAVGVLRADEGVVGDSSALPALRARLSEWITQNIRKGPIRVSDLAAAHNVSPRTVHRAFASTGDTMTSVIRHSRLAAARDDIVNTNLTMTAVAHRCGFYDPSHLAREFRRHFGVSPANYRRSQGV